MVPAKVARDFLSQRSDLEPLNTNIFVMHLSFGMSSVGNKPDKSFCGNNCGPTKVGDKWSPEPLDLAAQAFTSEVNVTTSISLCNVQKPMANPPQVKAFTWTANWNSVDDLAMW